MGTGYGESYESGSSVSLHNALWATTFSGYIGPGFNWNWDNSIHQKAPNFNENNCNHYFKTSNNFFEEFLPLSNFINEISNNIHEFTFKYHYINNPVSNPQAKDLLEGYFYLSQNKTKIVGWLHNRTHYWYNLRGGNNLLQESLKASQNNKCGYSPINLLSPGNFPDQNGLGLTAPFFNNGKQLFSINGMNLLKNKIYDFTFYSTKDNSIIKKARYLTDNNGDLKDINLKEIDLTNPDLYCIANLSENQCLNEAYNEVDSKFELFFKEGYNQGLPSYEKLLVLDINGDGDDEILAYSPSINPANSWVTLFDFSDILNNWVFVWTNQGNPHIIIDFFQNKIKKCDLDGDNVDEILGVDNGNNIFLLSFDYPNNLSSTFKDWKIQWSNTNSNYHILNEFFGYNSISLISTFSGSDNSDELYFCDIYGNQALLKYSKNQNQSNTFLKDWELLWSKNDPNDLMIINRNNFSQNLTGKIVNSSALNLNSGILSLGDQNDFIFQYNDLLNTFVKVWESNQNSLDALNYNINSSINYKFSPTQNDLSKIYLLADIDEFPNDIQGQEELVVIDNCSQGNEIKTFDMRGNTFQLNSNSINCFDFSVGGNTYSEVYPVKHKINTKRSLFFRRYCSCNGLSLSNSYMAMINARNNSSNLKRKIIPENIKMKSDRFSLYPNPFQNILQIINSDLQECFTDIFDCRGVLLKTVKLAPNSESLIDLSDFPNGLYIINAHFFDGEYFKVKVIKN
jgi:hypothetical protein